MKNKNEGFTLIELLIVIAIIGILAAIILTTLIIGKDNAKQKSAYSTLNSLKSSIGMCLLSDSMEVSCGGTEGAHFSSFDCGGGPNAIPVAGTAICSLGTSRSSIDWPDISDTGYSYGAYTQSSIGAGVFNISVYKEGEDTIFCCTQHGCKEMKDTGTTKGVPCKNWSGT